MWKWIKTHWLLGRLMDERNKIDDDLSEIVRLFKDTDDEYNWGTWRVVNNRLTSVKKAIARIERLQFDYKYK